MKDIAVVRTLTQKKLADHRGASYWMHTSYQPQATMLHSSDPWSLGAKLLGKSHETLPSSFRSAAAAVAELQFLRS
ncbi:MAG: hypothetical protein R3F31_00990 [Verrucomicrobiales bacterium]